MNAPSRIICIAEVHKFPLPSTGMRTRPLILASITAVLMLSVSRVALYERFGRGNVNSYWKAIYEHFHVT
jgi:hypothetical protein